MSTIPQDLRYSKEHEWVKKEGDQVVVGITDYAQHALGDVVFVEMPDVGNSVDQGSAISTIESVKAVSDIYAPLSGEIISINDGIKADPAVVNKDPYGAGWLFKMKCSDDSQMQGLLDATAYAEFLKSL